MSDNTVKGFQLSDKAYNFMKWLVQLVLPGVGTLYYTLATLWEWSNPDRVVGTITAITLFLGVILGISARSYNASAQIFDGDIKVSYNDEGVKVYSLELNSAIDELDGKQSLRFLVSKN